MAKNIKFEDLKIGQHAWAKVGNELLIVGKFDDTAFDVCGPWECGINPNDVEIIELVEPPIKYKKNPLYYSK